MKSFNVLNSTKNTIVTSTMSRVTFYLLTFGVLAVLALVLLGVKAWAQVPSSDLNKVTMTLEQKSNGGALGLGGQAALSVPASNAAQSLKDAYKAVQTNSKLFLNTLKVNLRLPTGYRFLDKDGGVGSSNSEAEFEAMLVNSSRACTNLNNNGENNSGFTANTNFFADRVGTRYPYYRITSNDRSTNAEFIISRPHDVSTTTHKVVWQGLTKDTDVTAGSSRYVCVEAVYTKGTSGDDFEPIYQYVAQRFIPRDNDTGTDATSLPAVSGISLSAPNNPAKVGDTITLRVSFNRAVKLQAIQGTSNRVLPYIYVRSNKYSAHTANNEYGDKFWKFSMTQAPSSRGSSVLEFKRTVQFGDEVKTDDNYQMTKDSLAEDLVISGRVGVRIHSGGYYIVDAVTGYLPSFGVTSTTAQRVQVAKNPEVYMHSSGGSDTDVRGSGFWR